jgi:hypothetical protein
VFDEAVVEYTIERDDEFAINGLQVNNNHMVGRVRDEVDSFETNESTLVATIIDILRVDRKEEMIDNTAPDSVADKLLVVNRIERYLGMSPENVGQDGERFVI